MKKQKKRSILAIVLGGFLIAALFFTLSYFDRFRRYQEKISSITFSDIDLQEIPDGAYFGEYDAELVAAKVEVTMKSGCITSINLLEHKNERGAAAQQITQKIIEQNQIDVDGVTGATNSSNVIKKAVENALFNK